MLHIFSSNPFYANHVHLPIVGDPPPSQIFGNPKFWPYFKDAIGALDGSHIYSAPPVNDVLPTETVKVLYHKIVSSVAPSILGLFLHILDGMGQQQIHEYTRALF
jgi:hypothetical protein